VSRLGLDWLKSARVQREQYVGPWLPEPVLDSGELSLEASTELAEDISMALMLAMERLSPLERAAFLLHDVLDVDYRDVAATLGREEPAVRQLAARARSQLRLERPRYQPTADETSRVLTAFGAALRTGDTAALHAVLADDVVVYSDGGGRAAAATLPIYGAERAARFLLGLVSKWPEYLEHSEPCTINGMPGVLLRHAGQLQQATAFQIEGGRVAVIYSVRNPDKLASRLT
jgi:RNA polymerase sigma-70 factor, ECF subfamily